MKKSYLQILAKEYSEVKSELTLRRFYYIEDKQREMTELVESGKMTDEQANKIQIKLLKEIRKVEIYFKNKRDYLIFSLELSKINHIDEALCRQIVKHEIEHFQYWKKNNIGAYMGWIKMAKCRKGLPYIPFCRPSLKKLIKLKRKEVMKLSYGALKAVSEKSPEDIKELLWIEKNYPTK